MALPIRYRLLGQLVIFLKINELLTDPIADLYASCFDSRNIPPKAKEHKTNSAVEKIRQQVIQLRAHVVRTVSQPRLSTAPPPHDPNFQQEAEAFTDLRPTCKVSQLSEEIEFQMEQLLLDVYESLCKARVDIARLKFDNRALRTELHSIKGRDGIGGIGALPLMLENRWLRLRIVKLESCNETLLLRENPFDDPESGWKCNQKVQQHVSDNVSLAKKEIKESSLERVSALAEIGYALRSRWIEQQSKFGKNRSTIMAGNEAAHHGFALADSWLYHPDRNDGRNDVSAYIEQYGMSPDRVYQLRSCKDLMTLLSWYGSVKSFHTAKAFPQTPFAKAWPSRFFEKYGKGDIEVVRAAFSEGKQASLLKVLKPLFVNEDAANKRKNHFR